MFNQHDADDLLLNIKTAFPLLTLNDITYKVVFKYFVSNLNDIEPQLPGQIIGDYEYIVIQTIENNDILFGRKVRDSEYIQI